MKSKILSLLLCCILALTFVGCTKNATTPSEKGKAPEQPKKQTVDEFVLDYEKGNSLFLTANGTKTEVNENSPYKDFVVSRKYTTELSNLTYTFYYTDDANLNIVLYMSASASGTVKLNTMFKVKLNDTEVDTSTIDVENSQKYENYFIAVKVSANAVKGMNKLEIIPQEGANGLCGTELTTGSSTVNIYRTNPTAEYGTAFEMDVYGEFAGDGSDFGASDDSPEKEFVVNHDYSGDKGGGGWNYTFEFYSETEQQIKVDFILAGATSGSVTLNTLYTTKFNDNVIDTSAVVVSNPNKVAFVYFDAASVTLTTKAGNNSIYVLALAGATNFSGIRITPIDTEGKIEPAKYVAVAGAKTFGCQVNVKIEGNSDTEGIKMYNNDALGFFGKQSQTLTYKIKSNKACTVEGVLLASPYSETSPVNPNTILPLKVNGVTCAYTETSLAVKADSFKDYQELHFTANLTEGENTIVLQGAGCGVNLDTFTLTPSDNTVVLDSMIPYEDTVRIECEHYYWIGNYYKYQFDAGGANGNATLNGETYSTSGGYNLGWFQNDGCYAIYGAYASKAGTAKMTLTLSPYSNTGATTLNDIFSLQVNNNVVAISDDVVFENVEIASYQKYTTVEIEVKVREGLNIFRITKTKYRANFDCFDLVGVDEGIQFCENWQDRR